MASGLFEGEPLTETSRIWQEAFKTLKKMIFCPKILERIEICKFVQICLNELLKEKDRLQSARGTA